METELWNAKMLIARLSISRATYNRWKDKGRLRRFEVAQPIGQRRYSSAKVEEFLKGKSIVRIGRGARS